MIKGLVVFLLILFFTVLFAQVLPAFKFWDKFSTINEGVSRAEVLSVLPAPNQEWAKASNIDIWVKELLLGGIRIDISYNGTDCKWNNRINAGTSCKVGNIYKTYYTIWGNSWFLSYSE